MRVTRIIIDPLPDKHRPERDADASKKQTKRKEKAKRFGSGEREKILRSQNRQLLVVAPEMNDPAAGRLAFHARLKSFAAEFLDQRRRQKRRDYRKSFIFAEGIDAIANL